jgi:hypothetical protein
LSFWRSSKGTAPSEGVREKPVRLIALTNATVVPKPGQRLERATVLIRDERIEAVGVGIPIPPGATLRDCSGLWVYPAFVEPYVARRRDTANPGEWDEPVAPPPEVGTALERSGAPGAQDRGAL